MRKVLSILSLSFLALIGFVPSVATASGLDSQLRGRNVCYPNGRDEFHSDGSYLRGGRKAEMGTWKVVGGNAVNISIIGGRDITDHFVVEGDQVTKISINGSHPGKFCN